MSAVEVGSAPEVVGTSDEPKAETMSLIPAASYSDLTVARSDAERVVHSYALSHAPSRRRNESRL